MKVVWLIAVLLIGLVAGNYIGEVKAEKIKTRNLEKLMVEMAADIKIAVQLLRKDRGCRCSPRHLVKR